jgi:hypothetical protein
MVTVSQRLTHLMGHGDKLRRIAQAQMPVVRQR